MKPLLFALLFFGLQTNAQHTAFINVNVVDVEQGRVLSAHTVMITGKIITVIGKEVPLPRGATIINAKGKYLIPGLCDFNAGVLEYEYKGEPALHLMLANGVTTVRNISPTMDAAYGRNLKAELQSGTRTGPHLLLTSPLITLKGTRNRKLVATTVAEGIAAIDSVVAEGADVIKIDNTLSPDVLKAVVQRAHHHRKPVIGGWTTPFIEAAEAGVNAIDHVSDLRRTTTVHRDKYFVFYRSDSNRLVPRHEFYNRVLPSLGDIDSAYFRQTIATLKKNNTWLCLNMAYMPNTVVFEQTDTLRARYRSTRMKEALLKELDEIAKLGDLPRYKSKVDMKEIKWAHDLGLPMVYGTQLYNFQSPGFTVHDGFYWMQENGFTPIEILRTATINVARFLKQEKQWGSIAVGKRADLVLLEANPLQDINHTKKIVAVMVNGKLLDKKAISHLLDEAKRQFEKAQ
jgi:imidazolonepropionase-like amidohydrolase